MDFIEEVRDRASRLNKLIVLPEGVDDRMIRAAEELSSKGITGVVLLGPEGEVEKKAKELGVDLSGVEIIEPEQSPDLDRYAESFYQKRRHKRISLKDARETIKDVMFFGAMMVDDGKVDGFVAGAAHSTAHTVRAALQVIGVAPAFSVVSSFFIMISPDSSFGKNGMMVFADCAVFPQPNSTQLAEIAIPAADNARFFLETEPQVAMLSFSTKGSAKHEEVDKVIEAVKIVRERRPDIIIDGEMQFDAAVIPEIGKKKAPGSNVAGKANVLVFPDLDAANIGYKIAQRMGKADAVGPFLQGLKKPCNDLSRGCSVEDIVNTSAVTAIQAASVGK